ncbi:MAG: hypothetical protein U1E62_10395 [Alsobacter sp.]
MCANRIHNIVVRLIEKQSITVDDVRELHGLVEEGGFVTPEEADALFRAERLVPVACASWGEFFVEVLTSHLVWECRPTGRITASDVDRLVANLAEARGDRRGHVGDLLLSIVRNAVETDERLIALVLAENAIAARSLPNAA